MSQAPGYSEQYPQAGDIALLCEGDIVGYESSILKRWIDQSVGSSPLVDVWPCGTADAIFGMTDAIGRARPLIVIEDRDFRSMAEAAEDCAKRRKDRERRAVQVLMWRAWSRAEIENYFLDKGILSKVMIPTFECDERTLHEGVNDVLRGLGITQAALYTFYKMRRKWKLCDPDLVLRSNALFRPTWDDDKRRPIAPDKNAIEAQLSVNVIRWRETPSLPDACALSWPQIQKEFNDKCAQWSQVSYDSMEWLNDWAGKEILQDLCRWMSARYGWYDRNTGKRNTVKWGSMKKDDQRSLDREIEYTLRPLFVTALLDHLRTSAKAGTSDEWTAILEAVQSRSTKPPALIP